MHSEYELAIMHRRILQLVWHDTNKIEHIGQLQPLDLRTENQAEYLLAQGDKGQPLKIRLDYIQQYRILD